MLGEVYHATYPYPGLLKENAPKDMTSYSLSQLDSLFELRISPERVAAILIEPVMGEGGYYPAPNEFLQGLRKMADQYGILLIFDEVQTGFGRTGKMFASEHSGVVPDILVLAKALSGGMPLGAIVASRELHEKWPTGAHGSTYGGNPVSCAAALASIGVIEAENLVSRSEWLGNKIVSRLKANLQGCENIKEIRGIGMMIGIEFQPAVASRLVPAIRERCLEKHLLIMSCGVNGQTIRLMLPLNIKEEDMEEGLTILENAIGELA